MSLRHWLQLALTRGVGPILTRRLIDAAGGSAERACAASLATLRNIEGVGIAKADAIHASLRDAGHEADAELARAATLGLALLCPDDDRYPALLRCIPDPPPVLYVKGALEPRDLNAVAIVGSRKCSYYGREQSERFAALLAGAGVTVISGGARGIDSAAHRGAMSHPSGRTIAVLGSGIDVPYPPENAPLFEQIAAGRGAVMSEYPLGTPPTRENFPRRNRIVSGLSRGVLVIEADERSGALITARQACDDHGRPVFAVPGRVDNPTSAGPHQLIRDGAVLAARLEDILDNLGPLPFDATEATIAAATHENPWPAPDVPGGLFLTAASEPRGDAQREAADDGDATASGQQQSVLKALGTEPVDVDAIMDRTGLSAQAILQELTFLTLKGRVKRVDGQTYVRR